MPAALRIGSALANDRDIYDALTTLRPYHNVPICDQEALRTMKQEVKKGWWDPGLFNEFSEMVTERRRNQRRVA